MIALGATQGADFLTQTLVVSLVALLVTVAVYGLVSGIVKFDDAGLALIKRAGEGAWGKLKRRTGQGMLFVAPKFMRLLTVLGVAAMFLVGGGIMVHGLSFLHPVLETLTREMGGMTGVIVPQLFNAVTGIITGTLVLVGMTLLERIKRKE